MLLPWTDREYGAVRRSPPPGPIIHTAPCESLRATSHSSRLASHSGCSDANCPRNIFLADRHNPNPIASRSAGVFRRSTSAIASSSTSIRRQSMIGAFSPVRLSRNSFSSAVDAPSSLHDSSPVYRHSSVFSVQAFIFAHSLPFHVLRFTTFHGRELPEAEVGGMAGGKPSYLPGTPHYGRWTQDRITLAEFRADRLVDGSHSSPFERFPVIRSSQNFRCQK